MVLQGMAAQTASLPPFAGSDFITRQALFRQFGSDEGDHHPG